MNQEFRLKETNEVRNYLIEEMNKNESISKKHEKVCRVLNCIHNLLIAIPTITGCVSISYFASLVAIPIGIAKSAIGLKICVMAGGIQKYKSISKEKKKRHDKIVLLAKFN